LKAHVAALPLKVEARFRYDLNFDRMQEY
jgi:hypothetical protein